MKAQIPEGMVDQLNSVTGGEGVPPVLVRAPGRVEVLGNHIDYNGGFVLASTIERYVWSLGVPSEEVNLRSMNFRESITFHPNVVKPTGTQNWGDFARGIYWAFSRRKHKIRGVTVVTFGDVPIGSGLGSSAAFEVSLVNLVAHISRLELNPKALAMLAFEAERLYCGVACGLMDQFTSQLSKPGNLLAIHCASLRIGNIPLSPDVELVVTDTMVSRPAYDALNERRTECQSALAQLAKAGWDSMNLSEIAPDQLSAVDAVLEETLARRVRHVVMENSRVQRGIDILREGQLKDFGQLMYESHASSRDLYEVSHPQLDFLVELAKQQKGVLGSRLTGAGLGGAIISLVKAEYVDEFIQSMTKNYEGATGQTPSMLTGRPPGGVIVQETSGM